jgi:rhodanese-related sulfurtransferase
MQDIFKNYGIMTRGLLSVTPREALELVGQGAFILDLREIDFTYFKAFDVKHHVANTPISNFDEIIQTLDPGAFYILADSSGLKTRLHAEKLLDKDFKHVATMGGGFIEWERDGLPVSVDVNERLSGACACQLKPRERK